MQKATSLLSTAVATLLLLPCARSVAAPALVVSPDVIASAKTAADHEAIAHSYERDADRLEKEAAGQSELAKIYGSYTTPKLYSAEMAKQCTDLAHDLKASASLDRQLAALHRKIAAEMGKN